MRGKADSSDKQYYYVDIDIGSRQIVGWGVESKATVEVHLTEGFHRLFLSKGQYNKFAGKMER